VSLRHQDGATTGFPASARSVKLFGGKDAPLPTLLVRRCGLKASKRCLLPSPSRSAAIPRAGAGSNAVTERGTMREALITRDGLRLLTNELEHLTSVGREEIAERLRHAMSTDANIPENSDYHEALKELVMFERRVAILRRRIHAAQVVEPDRSNDRAEIGERVRLKDLETGVTADYELVGAFEADPVRGRISILSPLGKALVGKRPGDTAVVQAPKGRLHYKVLAVRTSVGCPSGEVATGSPRRAASDAAS
jgi:transcription elongation factor GreA